MESKTPARLRPVDINTVEDDDEIHFVIQDPHRLSKDPLILTSLGGWVLQFMDGETSLKTIQNTYKDQTGEEVPLGTLEELVDILDQNYLLENQRAERKLQEVQKQFESKSVRPATLPGQSIPEDTNELNRFFEDLLPETEQVDHEPQPDGYFLPHIDFQRGHETYGNLVPYMDLIDDFETVIILGISHYTSPVPFSITTKDFETPYGIVETNNSLAERLGASLPYDIDKGEQTHRLEHSIEIPLLLLKHVHQDINFSIVPVICSFASENEETETLNDFVDTLESELNTEETLLLAGVDFAHMGPNFGDPEPLREEDYQIIESEDRTMLDTLEHTDVNSFEEHIQKDNNRRRVCGYPALRTIVPIFDEIEVLDYDQWQEAEETVSYGSGLLYK